MTELESKVLEQLNALEAGIAGIRDGIEPKPNLMPIFQELDRLESTMAPREAPRLRHYLQNKSYEKAKLWLLGRDAENLPGVCGGKS